MCVQNYDEVLETTTVWHVAWICWPLTLFSYTNLDTTWAIFHWVYEQTSLTNHTHPFYAKWAEPATAELEYIYIQTIVLPYTKGHSLSYFMIPFYNILWNWFIIGYFYQTRNQLFTHLISDFHDMTNIQDIIANYIEAYLAKQKCLQMSSAILPGNSSCLIFKVVLKLLF